MFLNQTDVIISVYLPIDYRSSNSDDFLLTLGELGGFINSHSFDNIIISGDFNTDFNNSSFRTSLLNNFVEEHDLVAIDTAFHPLIGHTYERDDGQSTSWPDHFLTNSTFLLI